MGNKLCKKKTDIIVADCPKKPSPTPFDRIITRLHLRPSSWKSESHLNHQKQVNRSQENESKPGARNPLSKSTDWTEASLEVPDEVVHLENPKLSLIFDNEESTPVPPPRKHKKGFREKLEAVAKSGLQVFHPNNNNYANKKPVEEPLCVKKTVNPTCPLDDHDCAIHNRNHKHEQKKNEINQNKTNKTSSKRKKNLSVVSLPNYNELKLTVATFDDTDKKCDDAEENHQVHGLSGSSLPGVVGKNLPTTGSSTGKLEICMTRCRSFGSLLPQQLLDKWRVRKIPTDIESDDSFGGLEDWDLRIIEHYNPKDASLPRPRKAQVKEANLSDLESLIVNNEEVQRPVAPVRKPESLLKKINRESTESAFKKDILNDTSVNLTPPPSPQKLSPSKSRKEDDNKNDHSSLMKILEKYSMMDKEQNQLIADETFPDIDNEIQVVDNTVKLAKEISSIQDFLNNEKLNISKDIAPPVAKFGTVRLDQAKV